MRYVIIFAALFMNSILQHSSRLTKATNQKLTEFKFRDQLQRMNSIFEIWKEKAFALARRFLTVTLIVLKHRSRRLRKRAPDQWILRESVNGGY